MVVVPSVANQAIIVGKLEDFIKALESHSAWTPPRPHPILLHVWDFVKRSHYIMTELENIRNGRDLKYPDQIPPNKGAKDNEERAQMSFTDVVTRTITISQIIERPSVMAMMGPSGIDFGPDIKSKALEVQSTIMSLPE